MFERREPSPSPTTAEPPQDVPQGPSGVFAVLSTEHREITARFARLTQSRDGNERRQLWNEVASILSAHEEAELQEVYPVFDAYPALCDLSEVHGHEVRVLQLLINELNARAAHDEEWSMAFERLHAAVLQHVQEEENDFFPRAEHAIGEDKARALEIPYLSAKRNRLR